jgi:predicted metal-dependent peptidase
MLLKPKEVEFLVGHEVLHVVYDHMGRIGDRDPSIFNIANDYAVNADLKRHRVGEFIKTVPCLFEAKYDGWASEAIYDDLMKNVQRISIDDLVNQMIDDHMDDAGEGEGEGEGENEGKKGKRPTLTETEREEIRKEVKQSILNAAQGAEAGSVPKGVERMIKDMTESIMPWNDLIQTNITSSIKSDFSWLRAPFSEFRRGDCRRRRFCKRAAQRPGKSRSSRKLPYPMCFTVLVEDSWM